MYVCVSALIFVSLKCYFYFTETVLSTTFFVFIDFIYLIINKVRIYSTEKLPHLLYLGDYM